MYPSSLMWEALKYFKGSLQEISSKWVRIKCPNRRVHFNVFFSIICTAENIPSFHREFDFLYHEWFNSVSIRVDNFWSTLKFLYICLQIFGAMLSNCVHLVDRPFKSNTDSYSSLSNRPTHGTNNGGGGKMIKRPSLSKFLIFRVNKIRKNILSLCFFKQTTNFTHERTRNHRLIIFVKNVVKNAISHQDR